jgi:hypothetical protein
LGRDNCDDTVDRISEHGHDAVTAVLITRPRFSLDGTAQ